LSYSEQINIVNVASDMNCLMADDIDGSKHNRIVILGVLRS